MDSKIRYHWIWQIVMIVLYLGVAVLAQAKVIDQSGYNVHVNLGFRLIYPLLFLGLSFLVLRGWRWYLLALSGTVLSVAMLSDLAYLRYFDTFPSLLSQIPLRQAWDVHASVMALLRFADYVWFLFFLGLWIYAIAYHRQYRALVPVPDKRFRHWPRCLGVGILLVGGIMAGIAVATPVYEKTHHPGRPDRVLPSEHWGKNFSNVSFVQVYGPVIYHVKDAVQAWSGKGTVKYISAKEQSEIQLALEEVYQDNQKTGLLSGAAKGFNVVIVQLEAFQQFLIDKRVDGREVTPFLNRLKKRGIYWDRTYDVTSLGRTSDAEFTINTGLYPDRKRASAFVHMDKDLLTLPNLLAKQGYTSLSVHGYNKDFWNRAQAHPFYGFKTMLFEKEIGSKNKLGMGTPDIDMFEFAVEYLKTVPKPFYSQIISLSCHHPFNVVPVEFASLYPSILHPQTAGYLKLASYTDQAVQIFFAEMEKAGLANKTIFIVCGDHDLGQVNPASPGLRPMMAQVTSALGVNPFDSREDRVPMMVVAPGLDAQFREFKKNYDYPCASLTDIFPTILSLVGEPIPYGIFGSNLLQSKLKHDIPQDYAFFQEVNDYRLRIVTDDFLLAYPETLEASTVSIFPIPGHSPGLSAEKAFLEAKQSQSRYRLCEEMLNNNLQKEMQHRQLLAKEKKDQFIPLGVTGNPRSSIE